MGLEHERGETPGLLGACLPGSLVRPLSHGVFVNTVSMTPSLAVHRTFRLRISGCPQIPGPNVLLHARECEVVAVDNAPQG